MAELISWLKEYSPAVVALLAVTAAAIDDQIRAAVEKGFKLSEIKF